jgi:hypothetical protein
VQVSRGSLVDFFYPTVMLKIATVLVILYPELEERHWSSRSSGPVEG